AAEQGIDAHRAPRRRPVGTLIAGAHAGVERLLVGAGEVALRGVHALRIPSDRLIAGPIAGARAAVEGDVAAPGTRPDRIPSVAADADVPGPVGGQHILRGRLEALHPRIEIAHAGGAHRIAEVVALVAGLARGPTL